MVNNYIVLHDFTSHSKQTHLPMSFKAGEVLSFTFIITHLSNDCYLHITHITDPDDDAAVTFDNEHAVGVYHPVPNILPNH